jgi:hypothetical protein
MAQDSAGNEDVCIVDNERLAVSVMSGLGLIAAHAERCGCWGGVSVSAAIVCECPITLGQYHNLGTSTQPGPRLMADIRYWPHTFDLTDLSVGRSDPFPGRAHGQHARRSGVDLGRLVSQRWLGLYRCHMVDQATSEPAASKHLDGIVVNLVAAGITAIVAALFFRASPDFRRYVVGGCAGALLAVIALAPWETIRRSSTRRRWTVRSAVLLLVAFLTGLVFIGGEHKSANVAKSASSGPGQERASTNTSPLTTASEPTVSTAIAPPTATPTSIAGVAAVALTTDSTASPPTTLPPTSTTRAPLRRSLPGDSYLPSENCHVGDVGVQKDTKPAAFCLIETHPGGTRSGVSFDAKAQLPVEVNIPRGAIRLTGKVVLGDLTRPSEVTGSVRFKINGLAQETDHAFSFRAPYEFDLDVSAATRVTLVLGIPEESRDLTEYALLAIIDVSYTY